VKIRKHEINDICDGNTAMRQNKEFALLKHSKYFKKKTKTLKKKT